MMPAETGRRLWAEIDSFAKGTTDKREQEAFFNYWISEVALTIGCATCFNKLRRFMRLWPIPYGEEFYLWQSCLHDWVNKELGKPLHCPDITLAPLMAKGLIQ